MLDADRESKKEYMKNYYYKRKNLLNHLINNELEKMLVLMNKFLNILKVFLNFKSIKKVESKYVISLLIFLKYKKKWKTCS